MSIKLFNMKKNYLLSHIIRILFLSLAVSCGTPLSFREQCETRNRCDSIETECYLRNTVYYSAIQNGKATSEVDVGILFGTCSNLQETCKKNCESGTIF